MKYLSRHLATLAFIAVAGMLVTAGCMDTNGNGQLDSISSSAKAKAEKNVDNAANTAAAVADNAAAKAQPVLNDAERKLAAATLKAGKALENLPQAATVTPKIKSLLLQNPALGSGRFDVDTIGSKNAIVLRGTVKTEAQKALAQRIAEQHSEGYKIVNQLRVTG